MTRHNPASAANGRRGGRPPKPLTEKALVRGKVQVGIDPETAALAQRLMLHFPWVPTIEALFKLAVERLAETTDD